MLHLNSQNEFHPLPYPLLSTTDLPFFVNCRLCCSAYPLSFVQQLISSTFSSPSKCSTCCICQCHYYLTISEAPFGHSNYFPFDANATPPSPLPPKAMTLAPGGSNGRPSHPPTTKPQLEYFPHTPPPSAISIYSQLLPSIPPKVSKLDANPPLLCPAHVILPPPAGAAPLWEVWTPTPFGRSSLFVEFSEFMRTRLGLAPPPTPSTGHMQQKPIHIILVSRRFELRS